MSRNYHMYTLWMTIQDIIGPATNWPAYIRKLFWTKNVKYFNRAILASFVFVNGLNPQIFMEWAELLHLCRDRSACNHFQSLFAMFEAGKYIGKRTLYAYNVTVDEYQYVDGSPHSRPAWWKVHY